MTGYENLTDEQAEAIAKAASHVSKAREEAFEMLRREGIEPGESGLSGPCTRFRTTPRPHPCNCTEYEPLGSDRCTTKYEGPDLGQGPVIITCQHGRDDHVAI